jgi:hypothetical protein
MVEFVDHAGAIAGQRLQRERDPGDEDALRQELRRIQREFMHGRDASAPSEDEILGYDEHGIPG